jgi:hypothetical protein
MPTLNIQGQQLEFSERDLLRHIIELSYLTCSTAAVFGSLQYDDSNQSLTEIHLDHLREVGQSIEDEILQLQLQEMIVFFLQAQDLNDQLLEIFSARVDFPVPATQEEFQLLIDTLEAELDANWYPLVVADQETSHLVDRINSKSQDLAQGKMKILRRLIHLCPDLLHSHLIIDQDRERFEE